MSYGQIEAAAQALLATGMRPTVEGVREALKAGSPRTLLSGLQRFWKELGDRLSGVPDTRRRLPAAVADLADTLWHTALTLAIEAAEGSDAAIKAQLAQLRADVEVRGQVLAQREIEMESLVRSRERTLRELEEHLRATLVLVSKRDATIHSLEARLGAALSETEGYRQRLATVVSRAVTRHRNAPLSRPRISTPGSTRVRAKTRRPPPRHSAQKRPRPKTTGRPRRGAGRRTGR